MKLFVFGLGYSAGHYVRSHHGWTAVVGTARAAFPDGKPGIDRLLQFDSAGTADPTIEAELAGCDAVLVSVQPGPSGDPVLARFGETIGRAPAIRHIVYLSTVGVYGDHGGAWIDETTPPAPLSERGRVRVAAEQGWLDLGRQNGKAVQVLRLAGIYGPGRNALADLAAGEARRILKPGQVFNRIHVEDIGRSIEAAFKEGTGCTVWNVADDEPAPAPDVIAYAATLLGVEPPPLVPFAEATLSPMARSFYGANRRIANRALKDALGVRLAYPTFREGLQALASAGEGRVTRPC